MLATLSGIAVTITYGSRYLIILWYRNRGYDSLR